MDNLPFQLKQFSIHSQGKDTLAVSETWKGDSPGIEQAYCGCQHGRRELLRCPINVSVRDAIAAVGVSLNSTFQLGPRRNTTQAI